MTRCRGCAATWAGTQSAHCPACHTTWRDVAAFDGHRADGTCRRFTRQPAPAPAGWLPLAFESAS